MRSMPPRLVARTVLKHLCSRSGGWSRTAGTGAVPDRSSGEWTSRCGRGRCLHRYPAQLSGGQRQRVSIARAIVTEPELLLADEPTSMLDASAGVGILNLFRELAQGGMALLVTLHDMAFACYAADRILILSQGVVVEEGPPAELLADARHDLTRRLVAAARVRDISRGAGEPVEA